MNGNDLLIYSHMKQHQARLLREAEGLHLARWIRQTKRNSADGTSGFEAEPAPVDPRHVRLLRPGGVSKLRVQRPDTVGQSGRPSSSRLRRLAARVGNSLVAVGQRLERMDR